MSSVVSLGSVNVPLASVSTIPRQGCFKLDTLSLPLFQPFVCISSSLWDLQMNFSRDSSGLTISTVVNPTGMLGTPSSANAGKIGICGTGDERPIVIKIMQTFGKGTSVQQRHPGVWTAHAVVAIYWPQANVLEYWNPSGQELEPDLGPQIPNLLSSMVQPIVSGQTGAPIRFIDTSPKRGSLDIGTELGYCETWIWFWVYVRTVSFCNAQLIDAWLLSLQPMTRTQTINEFWNSVNKGIAPETMSPLWQGICQRQSSSLL